MASLTSSRAPEETAASSSQHIGTALESSLPNPKQNPNQFHPIHPPTPTTPFTYHGFHGFHCFYSYQNPYGFYGFHCFHSYQNPYNPYNPYSFHGFHGFHVSLAPHCASASRASLPFSRFPRRAAPRFARRPTRRRPLAERADARLPPSPPPAPRGYHPPPAVPARIHRGGGPGRGRIQGCFSGRFVEWRKTGARGNGFAGSPPKRCQ